MHNVQLFQEYSKIKSIILLLFSYFSSTCIHMSTYHNTITMDYHKLTKKSKLFEIINKIILYIFIIITKWTLSLTQSHKIGS